MSDTQQTTGTQPEGDVAAESNNDTPEPDADTAEPDTDTPEPEPEPEPSRPTRTRQPPAWMRDGNSW